MQRKDNKTKDQSANSRGKIKAFAFGFEMEGNSAELAEGIKAFTTAMAKSGASVIAHVPARRSLGAPKPGSALSPELDDQEIEDENAPEIDGADHPGDDEEVEEETNVQTSSNGAGKKRTYTYKPPELLNIDLGQATKTLADFLGEKGNPSEMQDRYLAIAVWFKEFMSVDVFTISHIYAGYLAMGWKSQMPDNHSQPLRDMRRRNNYLSKEQNGYKVTWVGEQYVAKMGGSK